jgi:hypothetical protein
LDYFTHCFFNRQCLPFNDAWPAYLWWGLEQKFNWGLLFWKIKRKERGVAKCYHIEIKLRDIQNIGRGLGKIPLNK